MIRSVMLFTRPRLCETKTSVPPPSSEALQPVDTLALEGGITDGKHLVDQQDVDIHGRDRGEAEPSHHAGRIALDRCVDHVGDPGELQDPLGALSDLPSVEPIDPAEQAEVLPPGQLGVEPDDDVEEGRDLSVHVDRARRGRGDVGDELEDRGLAGSVVADDPYRRTGGDREGHVLEGVEAVAGPPLREELRHSIGRTAGASSRGCAPDRPRSGTSSSHRSTAMAVLVR